MNKSNVSKFINLPRVSNETSKKLINFAMKHNLSVKALIELDKLVDEEQLLSWKEGYDHGCSSTFDYCDK